jgi:RNA polymerase sigma factor (sigma-70 family)
MNTLPRTAPAGLPRTVGWNNDLVSVYRERYGNLVRLAYLLTGQAAIAEEIVQDAFVATHHRTDRLRDPYAYVRGAVVNRCRSWGRRHSLELRHLWRPPDPAELPAFEMRDALGSLSDRQRVAIVLRFYEDMPETKIAEFLSCRPATVRSLIHRGLKSLRRVIEQ